MGKKIGIAALIMSIICVVLSIIYNIYAPEVTEEMFALSQTDSVAYLEAYQAEIDALPTFVKVCSYASSILSILTIILAIVSIVKINIEKSTGKKFAVWALVITFVISGIINIVMHAEEYKKAFEYGFQQGYTGSVEE